MSLQVQSAYLTAQSRLAIKTQLDRASFKNVHPCVVPSLIAFILGRVAASQQLSKNGLASQTVHIRPQQILRVTPSMTATLQAGMRNGAYPEGVGVHDPAVLALLAQVEVDTLGAAVASAGLDLPIALIAGAGEGRGLRVVQVVEQHHATVLGSAKGVELVVVALAEGQELLHPTQQVRTQALRMFCSYGMNHQPTQPRNPNGPTKSTSQPPANHPPQTKSQ